MIDLRYGVRSDPRDKLFAFLGVTTDELAVLNPPDYLVDTVQVYTRFTRTWINKNRSLDILGCCRPLCRFSGLPSWVPDWSDGEDRALTAVGFDPEAKHPLYKAGLGSAPLSVHLLRNASSTDPNCLILGGVQVDSVLEVGSTARREHGGGPPPDDLMLELRSIAERLSTDRAEFWRTLTMDLGWTGGRMHTLQKQAFERTLGKWLRSDCKKWPNRGFSLLFPRVTGMTFFTTVRGNMGLTENDAQAGDSVCVFFGGQSPFVIRKGTDERQALVGECYLPGIMDGEAMKEYEEGNTRRRSSVFTEEVHLKIITVHCSYQKIDKTTETFPIGIIDP